MSSFSRFIVVAAICCLILVESTVGDQCASQSSCSGCVSESLCGWCSVPVTFVNGKTGPQCVSFSSGGTPFTCEGIYSTDVCMQGYACDASTSTCQLAGPGAGTTLPHCRSLCEKQPKIAIGGVPKVTVCSASDALLKDLTTTVTPNNIEPGSDLKVTVKGTLSEEVTSGSIVVSASFDNIPIVSKTLDLCKELTCPVAKGPFTHTITHQIPNVPVSGSVDAKAVINAQDNKQVACVDVTVSI